jgi:hypothetical protein
MKTAGTLTMNPTVDMSCTVGHVSPLYPGGCAPALEADEVANGT